MLLSSSGVRLRSGGVGQEGTEWVMKLQTEEKWTGEDEERGGRSAEGKDGNGVL